MHLQLLIVIGHVYCKSTIIWTKYTIKLRFSIGLPWSTPLTIHLLPAPLKKCIIHSRKVSLNNKIIALYKRRLSKAHQLFNARNHLSNLRRNSRGMLLISALIRVVHLRISLRAPMKAAYITKMQWYRPQKTIIMLMQL